MIQTKHINNNTNKGTGTKGYNIDTRVAGKGRVGKLASRVVAKRGQGQRDTTLTRGLLGREE